MQEWTLDTIVPFPPAGVLVGLVWVVRERYCSGRLRLVFPLPAVLPCSYVQRDLIAARHSVACLYTQGERRTCTMNKGQQRRTSKRDKLLCAISFNKPSFRFCPEIPCGYCVCLLASPCRGACRSNLPGTLSGVSVPQRRSTARRVRLSAAESGSRPIFSGGNVTRTAPLRTEPTRTPLVEIAP